MSTIRSSKRTSKWEKKKSITPREQDVIDIIQETPIPSNEKKQKGTKGRTLSRSIVSKTELSSKALLSKEAALARIQTPFQSLIEDDLKFKLKSMGKEWKNVSSNPTLFEGIKQIASWLEWPPEISKDEKILVWKLSTLMSSLSGSSLSLFRGQGQEQLLSEGIFDRVEYHAFTKNASRRTLIYLFFPEPSPHHLRTLKNIIGGIEFFNTNDQENTLMVAAPTFYECWVKAGIAALLCSYKLSRSDVLTGEDERFYLQGLGEYYLQEQILRELLLPIRSYQAVGARYFPEASKPELVSITPENADDWKNYLEATLKGLEEQEAEIQHPSSKQMPTESDQNFLKAQALLASLTQMPSE